jgi:hypothetical protein
MDIRPESWKKGRRLFTESQIDVIKNYCVRKQANGLDNPIQEQ